jgi:nucleotide-binding universal stress UspA family protein
MPIKEDGMYSNILVPLDGSPRAERILPYVQELALKFKARVTLLQVVEPGVTMVTPYDIAPYNALEEQKRHIDEAKNYLTGVEGSLRSTGITVRSYVESGPIVSTISNVAERERCDLIAMASHGRSGVSRVFYGSVAAGVLHRAEHPLLLIRAQNGH